jgi:hypothetical protein
MTRKHVSGAALVFAIAMVRAASAEPLADIDLHVIRYDKKQEIAIAVVDSIWRLSETKPSADSTYTVTCPITGTSDQWYLRLQRGDTIQVNFSQKRLSIPSTGIQRTCNCVGKPKAKPRPHILRAIFFTSVGPKDSIKVPGRFGPQKIGFRLRISWDTEFTLAAPDPPRRSL